MKRLLLLPVLMLGLSFSCDQPHEEVAGIKIGCPFTDLENFESYRNLGIEIHGAKVFSLPLEGEFFDSSNVFIIDGFIEEIILRKFNFTFDKDVMYELIKSLIDRWGNVEIISSEDEDGSRVNYVFDVSSSIPESNMDMVLVSYSLGNQELNLIYKTKKQELVARKLKDEVKRQRSEQFNKL